jgi:hypothetical protein
MLAVVLLAAACERHHIPLDAAQVLGDIHRAPPTQLDVLCSVEEDASDPLPIDGSDRAFSRVKKTLEDVVAARLSAWASASQHTGGWELRLNLYRARVNTASSGGHAELGVRATLTSGVGELYADQTRVYCNEDGADPTAAIDTCMRSLAHHLEHWIQGVKQ